jgi:hypothetical protein
MGPRHARDEREQHAWPMSATPVPDATPPACRACSPLPVLPPGARGVDFPPARRSLVGVSGVRKQIVTVCLLAFWLVATQHCGLEAAGFFGDHDDGSECCATSDGCANDGCATVEDGDYGFNHESLTIASPQTFTCFHLVCWSILPPRQGVPGGISLRRFQHPPEWVPVWQFERRAAAPAHAPDSSIA